MSRWKIIQYGLAAIAILGLSWWLTSPNDELGVGPDCEVTGLENHIIALARPHEFWTAQLAAVREARAIQERLQARSGFGAEADVDRIETPIERRMDRLSQQAEARQRADSAQQARLDRIAWMTKCELLIDARLKD